MSGIDRRKFLAGSGLGALAAVGLDSSRSEASPNRRVTLQTDGPESLNPLGGRAAVLPAIEFHGRHQAGIVTRQTPAASYAAFDITAGSRSDLRDLLRTLTDRARFLTQGGVPDNLGLSAPPSDSGTVGPVVPADGLAITVGVGSSLFDDRFGLAKDKPRHLTPMRSFPNDDLDPAQTGGDLLLQITAGSPDVAIHALRTIAKHTNGAMQLRWRIDGFVAPPRPHGAPRNHLGFKDGIANPDVVGSDRIADELLWVGRGHGEPAWAEGGSYHVCRIIKMFIEFWDRVSLTEQQQMIGRFRDSGAPLDGTRETDLPDFRNDPHGQVIPLDAHIRLANPRLTSTEHQRIYRRGYNYDRGVDLNGNLDMGLIFNCFQRNLKEQFEAVQQRLIGEPMVDYISPVGGGYFFALPGVRSRNDWYASQLLSS